jgi:hypothetical protein
MSGPKVDIVVGKEKKFYSLPKLLLCHYSPYFDRCFNGKFIEAKSQKLQLPEDRVDDFEILLEYMLRGQLSGSLVVKETGGEIIKRCINFLEYADKYDLATATCEAILEPLKKVLGEPQVFARVTWIRRQMVTKRENFIMPEDIQTIYRIAPAGSPLRTLVAQGALSAAGIRGCHIRFKKQIEECPDFAADLLGQICTSLKARQKWIDPITNAERIL